MHLGYIIKNIRKHRKIKWEDTSIAKNRTLLYRIEKGVESLSERLKPEVYKNLNIKPELINCRKEEINDLFMKFKYTLFDFDTKKRHSYLNFNLNNEEYLHCDNYYLLELMQFIEAALVYPKKMDLDIDEAYNKLKQYDSFPYIYFVYVYYGRFLKKQNKHKEAIECYERALLTCSDIQDRCIIYPHLAGEYTYQKRYLKALRYMLQVRDIAVEYHVFRRVCDADAQIAFIYCNLGFYDKGIDMCYRTMENESLITAGSMNILYLNTSFVHLKLNDPDKAYPLLLKAEKYDSNFPELITHFLYYYVLKNIKTGVDKYYQRAMEQFKVGTLHYRIANLYKAYFDDPASKQAEELALEVYMEVGGIEDTISTVFYLDMIINIYKHQKEYQKVIVYMEEKNRLIEEKK